MMEVVQCVHGGGAKITNNVTVHIHIYAASEPLQNRLARWASGYFLKKRPIAIEGAATLSLDELSGRLDRELGGGRCAAIAGPGHGNP